MRLDLRLVVGACLITLVIIFTTYSTYTENSLSIRKLLRQNDIYDEYDLLKDRLVQLRKQKKDEKWSEAKELKAYTHDNLHPDNLSLIDLDNFQVHLNQDICNVSDLALVTIIHSAIPNKDARKIIRETWGNPNIPGVNTRLVFLLGRSNDIKAEETVQKEAYKYNDIVQGDFLDSYHNLSYKNVFGKLWVSNFCEQAEFVVKTDDDMFIDLYATYYISRQYLDHPQYKSNEFVMCPVWYGMPILRDQKSKWYVSYEDIPKEEAPDNNYPPYCTGWIYLLNPGTAGRLVEAAKTTKFLWIDDAWVTGYLVKALNFKHLNMFEYFEMRMEKMLLMKTAQNPDIYHNDYLAAPMNRNYEISYTMTKHAEWCYLNKCYNNIYQKDANLTEQDKMMNEVIQKKILP